MVKHKQTTLRLILGDQLNELHSWFRKKHDNVVYVMMEVRTETDYAWHHIQKLLAFFSAMRQFAASLKDKGHHVIYLHLNDKDNRQSFEENLSAIIEKEHIGRFEYQLPDEYRVDEMLKSFCKKLSIEHEVVDAEHFYSKRETLKDFFKGKNNYLMESFYRYMRKENRVMMDGDEPLTGKWNYDASNRKSLPANFHAIATLLFDNDVSEIKTEIDKTDIFTIGKVEDARHFIWPVNRKQSLKLLHHFVHECLPQFGNYQDAMSGSDWSLYHSRLSFAMNSKMISPKEVVDAAIEAWQQRKKEIDFNQLEGFVRQIIGWREFMRGVYWAQMPAYETMNFFNNKAKLPAWYWNGKTKMNCLKHAIGQSLQYAYAHHIQRLMITGNFALLAGIKPDDVDSWYLGIYIDAIQWVELTNTRGMSQFADGGMVGTKPYVSSAAYINRMSDYCKGCYYSHSKKTGDKACPFNSLYWNFLDAHKAKLNNNPRMALMYKAWDRMKRPELKAILQQAEKYLEKLEEL